MPAPGRNLMIPLGLPKIGSLRLEVLNETGMGFRAAGGCGFFLARAVRFGGRLRSTLAS